MHFFFCLSQRFLLLSQLVIAVLEPGRYFVQLLLQLLQPRLVGSENFLRFLQRMFQAGKFLAI